MLLTNHVNRLHHNISATCSDKPQNVVNNLQQVERFYPCTSLKTKPDMIEFYFDLYLVLSSLYYNLRISWRVKMYSGESMHK